MLLTVLLIASRTPVNVIFGRGLLILPFSITFALVTLVSGNRSAALAFAEKSFLSGLAVIAVMTTTPLLQLLAALKWAKMPQFLVLVIQFLYRYLFVISTEAGHMKVAARSRQGLRKRTGNRFRAAAGAVGVLFIRSTERADGIYRAMLARGFTGTLPSREVVRFQVRDLLFCCAGVMTSLAVRFWLVRFPA